MREFKEIIEASIEPENMIHRWNESDFGVFVVTGIQAGGKGDQYRVGKVVQVRKESGAFGSDTVFIRHFDGSLWTHENQAFWRVPEFYIDLVKDLYEEDVLDHDKEGHSYSINGQNEKVGFIITNTGRGFKYILKTS